MELEGELSPRETKSARVHLEACWRCRTRRQELEGSITGFMQAHQQEFDGQLPPGSGPRALLKAQLASISASAPNRPFHWFDGWERLLRSAAVGVAVLLVAGWMVGRAVWLPHQSGDSSVQPQLARELLVSTPDLALTPGATLLLSRRAVCSQANVKNKDVPAPVRRMVFEEYGLTRVQARAYEVDYLVTPALGGSDDIHNLWPHSYSTVWNARVKDALEDLLRDRVCGGDLDLAQAQREIAANWIEAYKKYFHTDRPLAEHR